MHTLQRTFKQVHLTSELYDDCTVCLLSRSASCAFGKARNCLKRQATWRENAQMSLKALAAHNLHSGMCSRVPCMDHLAWMIWRKAYLQPSDWLTKGILLGHLDHQLLPRFHVTPVSYQACQLTCHSLTVPLKAMERATHCMSCFTHLRIAVRVLASNV